MPRGRPTQKHITLTPEEHAALVRMQRKTVRMSAGVWRRARLILLVAGGAPIQTAARSIDLSNSHAHKWLEDWLATGFAGLQAYEKRRNARTQGRRERIPACSMSS